MPAYRRLGHRKRLLAPAVFFSAFAPLPSPSNRPNLDATAKLVPKWIPPSPAFWAAATTLFFALAAVALLANRFPPLTTRLLTMMLVIFGLLVWAPLLSSDSHSQTNWSECAEAFAIAGSAWLLADLLANYPLNDHRPR